MKKELEKVNKILELYSFQNELGEEIEWTKGQKEIMAPIINVGVEDKNLIQIETPTRYGKSAGVAAALICRCTMKEEWAIVAGTADKAQIIMDYLIDYALNNTIPRELLKSQTNIDKLKQERSRRALTFSSGFTVRVFSSDSRNKQATGNAIMGFGCLTKGQKIMTDKGLMRIEDIVNKKANVKVLSFNHRTLKTEYTDILDYQKNPRGNREVIEVETPKGILKCTEDHPVFVEGKGYIKAKELREGDVIWSADVVRLGYANKLRDLWNRVLQAPRALQESANEFLQSQMPWRRSKRREESELDRTNVLIL